MKGKTGINTLLSFQASSKDSLRTPTHLTSFHFLFSSRWPHRAFLLTAYLEYCKNPPSLAIGATNRTTHDSAGDFHYGRYPSHALRGPHCLTTSRGWTEFPAHGQFIYLFLIRIRGISGPSLLSLSAPCFLGRCVHCQYGERAKMLT